MSISTQSPRLAIVIVNYNSWPDVVRLVGSLSQEPELVSGVCQIVVVDNASGGPVPAELASDRPGLRLIQRPNNAGFAAGVNAGWRAVETPWLLILNPDVDVEVGFLGQVVARLARFEANSLGSPGIVGFALRNPDGTRQGSVGRFPSLARSAWEQFIPRAHRKYQPGWRVQAGVVDWVTGACMLVNGRMIAELGGMDEDFFLYYEEVAFSRTARRQGWRVEYDPGLAVVHRHPLQIRSVSPKMRVILRHSKLLYFQKHLPRWQFLSLSWIVSGEALLRQMSGWLRGRSAEVRAWRTIADIARRLRRGNPPRGLEVLRLAESTETTGPGDPDPDLPEPRAIPTPRQPGRSRTARPGSQRQGSHGSRSPA